MAIPLHPALVHLPLGVAVALPLVAAGLTIALWRGKVPRTAFAVVAGLLLLVVGGGFAAMQAGERDAHQVETVVAEQAIEAHEDAAETFVWGAAAVLVVSLSVLVLPARWSTGFAALATAGTLAVAGLGLVAGKKGGELVYQHGATRAFLQQGAPAGGLQPVPARAADDD